MKCSEVTVKKLKALGYVARRNFVNAWRFGSEEEALGARQSKELFDLTVRTIREGGGFEIRRNNRRHTVEITVRVADTRVAGCEMYYYLSRPMTEAEVFEANQYTGVWSSEIFSPT